MQPPPPSHTEDKRTSERAKRALATEMARRGYYVLTVGDLEGQGPAIAAPKGPLLTPEILCLHPKVGDFWCGVQEKGRPAWFRKYARWQHGIDFEIFDRYRQVQKATGKRVSLAVQEVASPQSLHQESPLKPGEYPWLFIWVDQAELVGEHMPDWPGGQKQPWRRGQGGQGGFLWPRNAMTRDPFEGASIGALLF
jgi:hypothetical protein